MAPGKVSEKEIGERKKERKSLLRTCRGLLWVAVSARSVAMDTYS